MNKFLSRTGGTVGSPTVIKKRTIHTGKHHNKWVSPNKIRAERSEQETNRETKQSTNKPPNNKHPISRTALAAVKNKQ